MSNKIPLASEIVAGLMSQEDKVKLDALPNSLTASFSASILKTHQHSASYFSMSSGSINRLSATTVNIFDLVVQNSNLTATAVVPDPLSSSIQRSNEFSSSYFSMSSGSINRLSATTVNIFDLIVQNSNLTSTIPDPLSSSIQRAHQFSSSYSQIQTGTFEDINANRLESKWMMLRHPFDGNYTATFYADEGLVVRDDTSLVSIIPYQISFNGGLTLVDKNSITSSHISASLIEVVDLVAVNTNITATIPDPLSSSQQIAHQLSGTYFTSTYASIFDLVVQNSNLTATVPDPLSTSYHEVHNLIASYLYLVNSYITYMSSTHLSATHAAIGSANVITLSSSIGRSNQISASYYNIERIVQIQVTDPNGSAITTGDGKAYFTIPIEFNGYKIIKAHGSLITGSTSGTPTVQIRNVTTTNDILSTAITIDIGDNPATSYTAATPPVINNSNNQVSTGQIIAVDIDTAGTGAKGLSVILTLQSP